MGLLGPLQVTITSLPAYWGDWKAGRPADVINENMVHDPRN